MAEASPTRSEVLKDFRTAAILDAARRVIGELGWTDASMERIAQEAGVAKGTLYLYFESKEDLLQRAIDHGLDQLLDATRQAVEAAGDPLERIAAAVHTGVAHARDNRALFQALVDSGARRRRADGGMSPYTSLLAELLAEGRREGTLRAVDPERSARILAHGLAGLVAESLLHGLPFPDDGDVDEMLDVFFHGLARRGDRP